MATRNDPLTPHPSSPETPRLWDWQIVEDDWWRTKFRTISWAYKSDLARPPHYQDRLARGRRRKVSADAAVLHGDEDVDLELSDRLCGVQGAVESLKRYEVEVAILPSDLPPPLDDSLSSALDHPPPQDVWDEKVHELLGGILEQGPLPEVDSLSSEIPLWNLSLNSPILSPRSPVASELTDSSSSVDSDQLPSTPKPTKTSYARVVSNESAPAPTVLSPLPSKLLSAAALTFIPSTPQRASSREPTTPPLTSSSNSSDSPFSSPTYNFHFPSLNSNSPADRKESRSLPPLLQKDESGFYVEVPDPDDVEADGDEDEDVGPGVTQSLNGTRSGTPRRPSAAFLPSFLTDGSPSSRSRNSKTREIVDRLRSSTSSTSGRKVKKSDRSRKASGTQDSESTGDSASHDKPQGEGWISAVSTTTIPPPPPQTQSTHHANGTGHKRGHGYKRSSGSSQSASGAPSFSPSTTTASLSPAPHIPALGVAPVPYPTGPVYPMPYGAPMPMQYPARGPWPMAYQSPGVYMAYQPFGVIPPVAPYGMVGVAPVAPPVHQPHPHALQPTPMFYDGKVKPVQ